MGFGLFGEFDSRKALAFNYNFDFGTRLENNRINFGYNIEPRWIINDKLLKRRRVMCGGRPLGFKSSPLNDLTFIVLSLFSTYFSLPL